MELFSEEHSKLLFAKEWLVAVDTRSSTPYLIKFSAIPTDLGCCVLVTDTKSVWGEVMNGQQLARRWRVCNQLPPGPEAEFSEEASWRKSVLELLTNSHSLGGIPEFSLESTESRYADLALDLECESFKWRWEVCYLGHKLSSELISKHLILPLISANYVAFTSSDAVGEMTNNDLEKAVDKVGRTARRSVDTHIKHALAKPSVATTLRRMTAMYNFIPTLPEITSNIETPSLDAERLLRPITLNPVPVSREPILPQASPISQDVAPRVPSPISPRPEESLSNKPAAQSDSATESDDDEDSHNLQQSKASGSTSVRDAGEALGSQLGLSQRSASGLPKARQEDPPSHDTTSQSSQPVRASKKPRISSSSDDSDDGRASTKPPASGTAVKRGTRQPIKRGGKRF
ncbi:hypothetical protein BDN72DRAFT_956922 [Pluteus cervinus]|uniref:Uncharacterized protein n=1 Tax=Pluteus cervinus TaxID=181527 RepID=A0ACD3B5L8_9AGAR|nr:hypothetical protein BDN72DRAFT_956922 [Pluteus cervinus]